MLTCENVDPPFLLGVHCVSTDYQKFEQLQGFDMAMAKGLTDRQKCEDIRLSWQQLENLRAKSSFTYTCNAGVRGSSPGTPTGGTDDDECPCSYSKKILSQAIGYQDLWDEDTCDLDEGGSCCGFGFSNFEFPGECTFDPNFWFWVVVFLGAIFPLAILYVLRGKIRGCAQRQIDRNRARRQAKQKAKQAEQKQAEQMAKDKEEQATRDALQLARQEQAAKAAQLQFAMEGTGEFPSAQIEDVQVQMPVAKVTPAQKQIPVAEVTRALASVERQNP